MSNNQSDMVNMIIDEKYFENLTTLYPKKDLKKIIVLNIEIRLLYLKYLFLIEHLLKNILMQQLFFDEVRNLENSHLLNQDHLSNLKDAQKIIRKGYLKYCRNGILKTKTIRSLIEVMSFEGIMSLLATLNQATLSQIAEQFLVTEFNNHEILLEQLNYLKDIRNYLSHNFKVLGVAFSQKRKHHNYYQQTMEANNDHHYLHLIINKFASISDLLPDFNDEYQSLFTKFEVTCNKNLVEKNYDESRIKST